VEELHRKTCKRRNWPCQAHALTFSCYRGQPFLLQQAVCQRLAESLGSACERHDFALWAYVFMPEHVHILVWPRQTNYSISAFLQSVKQPVARWAVSLLKGNRTPLLEKMATGQKTRPYRFWQAGGGYDRNIIDLDAAWKEINYIHLNPVRRKLVENPHAYFYSSFKDWNTDAKGPIAIDRKSFYVGCTPREAD
jgi:putative transposase